MDRLQRFNVVPVVDMTLLFFEMVVCVKTSERRRRELRKCQESEFTRNLARIEKKDA